MGYYTRFELTMTEVKTGRNGRALFDAIVKDAKENDKLTELDRERFKEGYIKRLEDAKKQIAKVPGDIWQWLDCGEGMKWYEHEEHMKALSKAFPDLLFQLDGHGEENADIWRKWFLNGKMQGGKAKLVMPEFDPKAFK